MPDPPLPAQALGFGDTAAAPPVIPAAPTLSVPVFCTGCGYAVRHLPEIGGCPECGRAVAQSTLETPVRPNSPEATARFRGGLGLTLASAVATAVIPWLTMLMGFAGGDDGVILIWALMVAVEHGLWGAGVHALIFTPNMYARARFDRIAAKWAGLINALGGVIAPFLFLGAIDSGDETTVKFVLGLIVVAIGGRLVCVWLLGGYLRAVLLGLGVTAGLGLLGALRWLVTLAALWAFAMVAGPWLVMMTGTENLLNSFDDELLGVMVIGGFGAFVVTSAAGVFATVALGLLLRNTRRAAAEYGYA